jgi:anthranilate phosphoribosyltransferase
MSDVFKPLLGRLADGATLSEEETQEFFAACLRGEPTPAQVAAALTAMRLRGETVGELTAAARAMRAAALRLEHPFQVIDVCGTGGDGLHTLNVSTAVGFVAAAGGLKVAKHGNRAASSRSGAADVLSALGVNIMATRGQQLRALDETGITFLFAQAHHGSMRHVTPIRAELGFRTVFNMLGPLANPAWAQRQLLGVYDARWLEPMVRVLGRARRRPAPGPSTARGIDELTTTGESRGLRVEGRRGPPLHGQPGGRRPTDPRDFAELRRRRRRTRTPLALRALLAGAHGAYRDIVLLNAAAAFVVGDKRRNPGRRRGPGRPGHRRWPRPRPCSTALVEIANNCRPCPRRTK